MATRAPFKTDPYQQLYAVTQWAVPNSGDFNRETYEYSLTRLKKLSKDTWFRRWWEEPKSGGRFRVIQPAQSFLVQPQLAITQHLVGSIPQILQYDHCYSGYGVIPTVRQLNGAKTAVVLDLSEAFEHVTPELLEKALFKWAGSGLRALSGDAIKLIVYLTTCAHPRTSKVRTPQGCVSSPYLFDLVMIDLDQALEKLFASYRVKDAVRYSDNFCVVFEEDTRMVILENFVTEVTALIKEYGFKVGTAQIHRDEPITFLGCKIYGDQIDVKDAWAEEFVEFLTSLLALPLKDPSPREYHSSVMGMYSWLKQIYGEENIPLRFLELIIRYKVRIRKSPLKFVKLLAKQLMKKLPKF